MAGPGALSKCVTVVVDRNSHPGALQTAHRSSQLPSCCACRSHSSLHFERRFFFWRVHRRSVQHFGKKTPGEVGRVPDLSALHSRHAALVCQAAEGVVDQNERLKDAAKAGDLEVVNDALGLSEVNVDLPSSKRAGWAALHLASYYGHTPIVKSLLTAGANVDVRNDSGNTPLHLASLKGNIGIAQILLDAGSDIYAEGSDRGTPLDYAQEWGGEEIVDFLLLWAAKSSLQAEAG